jgi:hypothetical protein
VIGVECNQVTVVDLGRVRGGRLSRRYRTHIDDVCQRYRGECAVVNATVGQVKIGMGVSEVQSRTRSVLATWKVLTGMTGLILVPEDCGFPVDQVSAGKRVPRTVLP